MGCGKGDKWDDGSVDAGHLVRYLELRLLWETNRASNPAQTGTFSGPATNVTTGNPSSPLIVSGLRQALLTQTLMSSWGPHLNRPKRIFNPMCYHMSSMSLSVSP